MKKSFLSFVYDQWSTVPPVETADLSGKTVAVVGANTGLGFEAAKHFARMNPGKLIIACRNESKGESAISDIALATEYKDCELRKVDLADFASVISFADKFQHDDRLDILVMNAGISSRTYEETVNGWESTLQVNHLGTALLSLLLLPRLVETNKKSRSTSRLVIVSSEVHYWASIPTEVYNSPNPLAILNSPQYSTSTAMGPRYHDSKLLNVFFTRALQDHIQSITPLTVNAVNPGFCYSGLRSGSQSSMVMLLMERLLAFTAEQGSRQIVYAAIGGRDNESRLKGAFISKAEVMEPSDFVIGDEGQKMQTNLWRETIEILTKEAPQLRGIIRTYLAD